MREISNHSLSGYLWALVFSITLGFSPVQNISASVSSCLQGTDSIHHHQMNTSAHHNISDNTVHADNLPDCCDTTKCASSHCISATTATMSSSPAIHISYAISNVYSKANNLIDKSYPSLLYRPPKV